MSSNQTDANTNQTNPVPIEIVSWDGLISYTQLLNRGNDKKYKICMIDEEQEEIRIDNKIEFDTNIKGARDRGLESIKFVIYIDHTCTFNAIYQIKEISENIIASDVNIFPTEKLKSLRDNTLVDKWYIPVKIDEALGICLSTAIKLAQEGKLDKTVESKELIEKILPIAFQKLTTTQSVFSWPREIQCGIFDMIELLIDLVATRLRYAPLPIALLNTLSIIFDTNTTFSQKHKNEPKPISRVYKLDNNQFLRQTTSNNHLTTYGWIHSFIERFMAQNGLKNLRAQFEYLRNSNSKILEYNCLLKLFSKCHQCIDAEQFRLIFTRQIRQAIGYYLKIKQKNDERAEQINQLNETLIELCFNYEMNDEVNQILELPATSKKAKAHDLYEQLADGIHSLTMNNDDIEQKNIKKQRTTEPNPIPAFSFEYSIDDILLSAPERSLKRKHRRDKQRHMAKNEAKRMNRTAEMKTYDRSNTEDIVRFFAPMKTKIAALYDDLQRATALGNIRDVLKIEEKLKLLRPYSARFIADENTPDGTKMTRGQVFRKKWILLNDGSMPWTNEDIQLVNLSDGIQIINKPIVPITPPHDRAIITVDFMCSGEIGAYESKWILSYRQRTFGPMIWCAIEVVHSNENFEKFELIDVPLPECFDLSKPYRPKLVRSSIEIQTEQSSLISNDSEQQTSPRLNQTFDFVDTVVTNIVSVAKQAGSTARAIFNTLQANEQSQNETVTNIISTEEDSDVNTNLILSNDPMDILIEMGFADRIKNQRLLTANNNNLTQVIEYLSNEENTHFH